MFCVFLRFTQSFIDLGAKWIFANLPFAFFLVNTDPLLFFYFKYFKSVLAIDSDVNKTNYHLWYKF